MNFQAKLLAGLQIFFFFWLCLHSQGSNYGCFLEMLNYSNLTTLGREEELHKLPQGCSAPSTAVFLLLEHVLLLLPTIP